MKTGIKTSLNIISRSNFKNSKWHTLLYDIHTSNSCVKYWMKSHSASVFSMKLCIIRVCNVLQNPMEDLLQMQLYIITQSNSKKLKWQRLWYGMVIWNLNIEWHEWKYEVWIIRTICRIMN